MVQKQPVLSIAYFAYYIHVCLMLFDAVADQRVTEALLSFKNLGMLCTITRIGM